ncbi:DUF3857 domain-containing transglutaminase family protein [Vibrio tapetis subsp. quintayensis]|uniref:DUF3857 domain-containing transglutaminase family protein n=1 Tax=Vibrio tapetis TaxID=52443 RepID=UPI0025B40309|nr:DUF3857 domain-containing transglutaminase family protein [Vibrio tapetis]MDN3682235.1 DUF3857 domain-containing transglutaminase family protein [Vibrio tapetis subsp. quintayensis]
MRYIGLFWLALVMAFSVSANDLIKIEVEPNWVIPQEYDGKGARKDRVDGSAYLLVDRQTNFLLTKPVTYSHYMTKAVNSRGVEDNSQISLTFAPSYEEVILHSLAIWRDGVRLNQLDKMEVKRFKQEKDLEQLLYNGDETYYIVLKNVEEGDVIDYSFSIKGTNPVFNGNVDSWFKIGWEVPVASSFIRILYPKNEGYNVRRLGDSKHGQVESFESEHGFEFRYVDTRREYKYYEKNQPNWFDEYPYIHVTNYTNWNDVVEWSLPLYQYEINGPLIQEKLELLKKVEDPEERVVAAIKIAQQSIRYLGMSNGIGSHAPRSPENVLDQGYGDCKDKVLLLVAMLEGIGIKATPALVNTTYKKQLVTQPAGHSAFNHVIVRFYFEGLEYWIDPTATEQADKLAAISQSQLGYALLIEKGQRSLVRMDAQRVNSISTTTTLNVKDVGEGETSMTVETVYYGEQADRMRRYFSSDSMSQVMDSYEEYFNRFYEGVYVSEDFVVYDDLDSNVFTVVEQYAIESFWYLTDEGEHRFDVVADVINTYIVYPESKRRKTPYYLGRPIDITQKIVLQLPVGFSISDDDTFINSKIFEFDISLQGVGGVLAKLTDKYKKVEFLYSYRNKQTYVDPSEMNEYKKNAESASDSLFYQFTRPSL